MKKILGRFFMILGLLLVLGAAGLLGYNTWDSSRAGEESASLLAQLELSETEQPPDAEETEPHPVVQREMTVKTIDGLDFIGYLSIPELNLELPVQDWWSYDGLQKSPGRYTGTTFTDDMTVCAHNYAAHFGRLRSLPLGAEVRFTDMDGVVWLYAVSEITVLEPEDVLTMTEKGPEDTWGLTLFTCTPGGEQRVTVRCDRTGVVAKEA